MSDDTLLNMSKDRITIENKRVINNDRAVDCNQLVPIKYRFAWNFYLDGCANHWMPTEVSMQRDIEQWKDPQGVWVDEERCSVSVGGPARDVTGTFAFCVLLIV